MDDLLAPLRQALVDRYDIEGLIGRGGMASVYRATDIKLHRDVAIKVIATDPTSDTVAERFVREVDIAARLQHPNIVPLFDAGHGGGILYYVMPFIEGESLRERLDRERQLPLEDAVQICRQVAQALAHAHAYGIVHRDIKPENILLASGQALVADFGIARAIGASTSQTMTAAGVSIGTPQYMSPEQASGDDIIDGKSDIYSLACVLFEMLTGEPPYAGRTAQSVMAKHALEAIPRVRTVRNTVPEGIENAVVRALAKVPADRFSTALEFDRALSSLVGSGGSIDPVAPPPPVLRIPRKVAALTAAIAAVVLLVVFWPTRRPALNASAVAVFPLRTVGMAGGEWSEALADLLATALDGTPGLSVVDPWSLWQPLRDNPSDAARSPDPDEATSLALDAGAGRFVLGSLVQTTDGLNLSIRTYASNVTEPIASFSVTGSVDSLLALVQEVAVRVIGTMAADDSLLRTWDLERSATHVPDALKAYLDAKSAMRRGLVDDANRAIDRAIALDSSFALALVEATVIKSWLQWIRGQTVPEILELADRAVNEGHRLGERDRLRAEGLRASIRTDGASAARAAQRILRMDTTDFEAWASLAHVRRVYGWQFGSDFDDAVDAAEQVISIDSNYLPGLIARAMLAASSGDANDQQRQLDRLAYVQTSNALLRGSMVGLRVALAPAGFVDALVDSSATLPMEEWVAAFRLSRMADPRRASAMARAREQVTTGLEQRIAWTNRVRLELSMRSFDEIAQIMLRSSARYTNDEWAVLRYAGSIALSDSTAATFARPIIDTLHAFVPVEAALTLLGRRPVIQTGWLVAAYHAMYGDTSVANQWIAVFPQLPPGGVQRDYRAALSLDVQSRLTARAGERDSALTLAEAAYDMWSIHTDNIVEDQPPPAIRFHLAHMLEASGQADSATAILRSLAPPVAWVGTYTRESARRLGNLLADQKAAARFRRIADTFANPER